MGHMRGSVSMLYCPNNLARQPLQGRLCKLSVWKKFHFNSWTESHCFFFLPRLGEHWIGLRAQTEFTMSEQKISFRCFVCYLQLKSHGIIPPLLIKLSYLRRLPGRSTNNHLTLITIIFCRLFSNRHQAGCFFYCTLSFHFGPLMLVQLVTVSLFLHDWCLQVIAILLTH